MHTTTRNIIICSRFILIVARDFSTHSAKFSLVEKTSIQFRSVPTEHYHFIFTSSLEFRFRFYFNTRSPFLPTSCSNPPVSSSFLAFYFDKNLNRLLLLFPHFFFLYFIWFFYTSFVHNKINHNNFLYSHLFSSNFILATPFLPLQLKYTKTKFHGIWFCKFVSFNLISVWLSFFFFDGPCSFNLCAYSSRLIILQKYFNFVKSKKKTRFVHGV